MKIVTCTEDRHSAAILAIFNDAIVNSTALYDYEPRQPESMQSWFAVKRQHDFPVIGVEDEAGRLMGFASYGTFRVHAACQFTVEHSIYIHPDFRGQGLGKMLLDAIVEQGREKGMHLMIGSIDADNRGSIVLHEKKGFTLAGTLNEVAWKFDRWLNLAFYQKRLNDGAATPGTSR
jgi:L-amino acid N-acyltransferase YncA